MKLAVLGSTGSIGRQAIEVCRKMSPKPEITVLSAKSNIELLQSQALEFGVKNIILSDPKAFKKAQQTNPDANLYLGKDGMEEALASTKPNVTLNAVWGTAGLAATLSGIKHSKRLALANKESLVCAGKIVMEEARNHNCEIIPIDSEQSAIFQALLSGEHKEIRNLILTASGGPFRNWSKERLAKATPEDALKHPTWSMGQGITIDSATLMNKALEIIEAKWLFDVEPSMIKVVIHPESIVHSIVEFTDFSCIAQLSLPDMRIPIQYSLTFPNRINIDAKPLNLAETGSLNFGKPDIERFPALGLAWKVLEKGGNSGAALTAANQEAVRGFIQKEIGFNSIYEVASQVLEHVEVIDNPSIEDILATHDWAKLEAQKWISQVH